MRKQSGFTLIEIAIVLVIIGLLLGGVLKGQELITSARVRNLISQQDGVKAAFYGFLDRYRAYPGDYAQASTNITGVLNTSDGNGNGQIQSTALGGAIDEHIAVWEHLSKAGFINGSYTYAAATLSPATSPSNPYAMFLVLIYDNVFDPVGGAARHNLKTGNQIPADILAEVDRKIDDGLATGGSFRFSAMTGLTTGTAPTGGGSCYAVANGAWIVTGTVQTNCAGASLF